MSNTVAIKKGASIEPILIGKKEAAQALGISLRSLTSLISKGDIETRRIGGRTLISVSELKRFASRNYLGSMAA